MTRPILRVGFVPGVEPDRFARRWKTGGRRAWLELVPVPASRQRAALDEGEVDMCFVRLPIDPAGTAARSADDLHVVALWEERAAVVVGDEHVLSLLDEISEEDLVEETELPQTDPDDAASRVAVAASGVGYARMPLSLARLHHRKDAVHRPLVDAAPTRIALVWPRDADDEDRQEFVGVVRGRTSRSSR
ncbi:LysR family transcriptional regulator substrate-binding protein [Brachybacterium sp. DNPG3]